MIYAPSMDMEPLKMLLNHLQAPMPEGTSCVWLRVRTTGVEVSFYYCNQVDGTYAYRTVVTPAKPKDMATLLAETFNVEFSFVTEITMKFGLAELATVKFEREITQANINVINYKLGL